MSTAGVPKKVIVQTTLPCQTFECEVDPQTTPLDIMRSIREQKRISFPGGQDSHPAISQRLIDSDGKDLNEKSKLWDLVANGTILEIRTTWTNKAPANCEQSSCEPRRKEHGALQIPNYDFCLNMEFNNKGHVVRCQFCPNVELTDINGKVKVCQGETQEGKLCKEKFLSVFDCSSCITTAKETAADYDLMQYCKRFQLCKKCIMPLLEHRRRSHHYCTSETCGRPPNYHCEKPRCPFKGNLCLIWGRCILKTGASCPKHPNGVRRYWREPSTSRVKSACVTNDEFSCFEYPEPPTETKKPNSSRKQPSKPTKGPRIYSPWDRRQILS